MNQMMECRIDDISSHIAEFLDRIDSPHIILLHISINDFGKFGKDRVNAIHRWSALLTKIYRLQPHAHIIATNLMYRHGSYTQIPLNCLNPIAPEDWF